MDKSPHELYVDNVLMNFKFLNCWDPWKGSTLHHRGACCAYDVLSLRCFYDFQVLEWREDMILYVEHPIRWRIFFCIMLVLWWYQINNKVYFKVCMIFLNASLLTYCMLSYSVHYKYDNKVIKIYLTYSFYQLNVRSLNLFTKET